MVPEPAMERSDPPSPKRQKKTEEETTPRYNGRPEGFESDECSDEEMELFDQELDRSGGVGDFYFFSSWLIDLSKFICWFVLLGLWNRLQEISLLFWLEITGSGR